MYYKPVGTCSQGTLAFTHLAANGIILAVEENSITNASIRLSLQGNKTFHVRYREYDFNGLIFEATMDSTWLEHPEQGYISFAGLGQGQILQEANRTVLKMTFTHSLNSPALTGKVSDFLVQTSTEGLGTDSAQYCSP